MPHLQNSLDMLVRRLSDNASLPKYQFERASEPLLSLFIEEWLSLKLGMTLSTVTMEFPLKKGESNGSTNADYLLASQTGSWYLVEMKTTTATLKLSQVMPYIKAARKGRRGVIREVKAIAASPNASKKYDALLKRLADGQSDDIRVIVITPHRSQPLVLDNFTEVIWFPLEEFFMFESKHHPELWSSVRHLREGIVWPNSAFAAARAKSRADAST